MISFIMFILACYGMTQILVYGHIFDSIRPKNKFFHCPMCVGFHVGYLVYILFILTNIFSYSFPISLLNFMGSVYIYGSISSGTSYILCNLFGDKGINLNKGEK